jgi:hypothetical protein
VLKNQATQVNFHTMIHMFYLAIELWAIGRAKPQLHLQCLEEGLAIVACEYLVLSETIDFGNPFHLQTLSTKT